MSESEPTATPGAIAVSQESEFESKQNHWMWGLPVALGVVVLGAWQALTSFHVVPEVVLPAPGQVWSDAKMLALQGFQGQTLWSDVWISAVRILSGFLAAVVIGVPLGLWMGTNRIIFKLVDPILQFVRPVPPLAYIPLMVVWFGIGEMSKTMVILLGTIPIIMISSLAGVRGTPRQRVQVAQCLGANRSQIFRYVILPSALPEIFTGMRVGIGVAWTCLVAAEMIGAASGLGWLVQIAGQDIQVGVIFVGIVAIGLLGYLMELCIRLIERRVVPWRGRG